MLKRTFGTGLTSTTAVSDCPGQLDADVWMKYETVAGFTSALASVWLIALPDPSDSPDMEAGALTVQLKDVPDTLDVMRIAVCVFEQMVSLAGDTLISGVGLTVIV